jgi:hypothetical protein
MADTDHGPLAQRVMRGSMIVMAVTTVTATAVGFWLSYAGLHSFATRAGLRGAEAWAWPASIDLFILAGELGITISAVRRVRDPLAWVYLAAGFGPSVLFNVLHVAVPVSWGPFAVAAVPPVAAMLALAATMRQVYRLAELAAFERGRGGLVSSPAPATLPACGHVVGDPADAIRVAVEHARECLDEKVTIRGLSRQLGVDHRKVSVLAKPPAGATLNGHGGTG